MEWEVARLQEYIMNPDPSKPVPPQLTPKAKTIEVAQENEEKVSSK